MLSLNKFLQTTKMVLCPRISASLQSASFSAKSLEEKLGLPLRPKKPLTPYFRYLVEVRPEMTKNNPKLSTLEIVQECAKKWANVDESTKQKLLIDYMKDKEQYIKQRAQYESKLTDEQKYEIEAAKQDLVESREKRAYKKKLRETGKPKKPASGFLRFLREAYAKNDRGGLENKEFLKKMANDWNMLPEEKKKVYNDEAKAEGILYRQELAKWELKMIRLGNLDLVRQEALINSEVKTSKRGRPKASRSKSGSDSDWEFGWCSDPFDDKQQNISSTTKQTQINSQPDPLPADDKHLPNKNTEEVPEVKLNLSSSLSSKRESDTTGESIKQSSNQEPAEPEPKPVPSSAEKPNDQILMLIWIGLFENMCSYEGWRECFEAWFEVPEKTSDVDNQRQQK